MSALMTLVTWRVSLKLTVLLSCQQEGSSQEAHTVHQWLRPLVCIVSNWTLDP